MASPEREAVAAAAVVEDVLRMHGEGFSGGVGGGGEVVVMGRNIDMAWRKAEVTAVRRNEAANWLRRTVGVVCARDLAEEPSEEEFRVGLRSGIILCNAVNKIQPGTVPKVVEVHSVSTVPADGSALCAYQYFENVRNFLTGLQDLGLPTFEVSDLEKGGQGVRVVDCVLALKSFAETKQLGKQSLFKHGGIVKPSMSAKCCVRKNEPFMKAMTRSHSAELLRDGVSLEQTVGLDCSLEPTETITSDSIRMLVQTILSDKKPEEVPLLVESLLSKVIHEFERRMANQNDLVKYNPNDSSSLSRTESTDTPLETEATSTCDHGKMDEEDMDKEENNSATNHVKMEEDKNSVTNNVEIEEYQNSVSTTGEVSASVPESCDDVEKRIQAKAEIHFELQKKHIQDLKRNISTVKSGIEQFKSQYSEDLAKLGNHLRIISHAASGYHKVLEENRKLYNQIQDLRGNIRVYCRVRPFHPGKESASSSVAGGQAKTLMFIHIAPEPDAIGESISTLKFAERVATVELGAAKTNKEGGEVKELKEQIACLKTALASKDGENENIRSSHSSPDILRDIKIGHTSPASGYPMEEVGCEETRSNCTPRQTKPNFELSDVLVESDPSSWIDACNGDNTHLRSSNSLPELGPDATHDFALYQRSSPEQQLSWAGSVATEDSDDCEVATTCSSEQDSVRPASAPKASAFANGSGSAAKKAQSKSVKSTDIRGTNPAKKISPSLKKANGAAHVPIKNGKQPALGGVDGRKTPNGKVSTKK
ncbi:hypothetical protein ACQ4PT_037896 [Festuca glaucescens]